MKYRWLVVAFALVAASMFAISAVGGHWWTVGDSIEIGPFGSRRCVGDDCTSANLGPHAQWLRFGIATWAACLIAALVLVITAAGVAARRVPKLGAQTSLVAIATAAVSGGMFIAKLPSMPAVETHRGVFLFAGAILVGAVAAITVARARPPAPDQ